MRALLLALLSKLDSWLSLDGVRANDAITVTCNCLPESLPVIAKELQAFGARVLFEDGWSGIVASESGTLRFKYSAGLLVVTITEDFGHFPRLLLIGGIKQTVSEANETVRRAHAEILNPFTGSMIVSASSENGAGRNITEESA